MAKVSLTTSKSKGNVIELTYQGAAVSFDESGWFNATDAAARYGKRPNDWLSLDSTKDYLTALSDVCNTGNPGIYMATRRGKNGGTWMAPELAVPFARWLDVRFAIWCDQQIRMLISGSHPHFDWKRARSESASSFKVMNAILQLRRQEQGKETASHHFSNEARLVNWALTGEFKGLDREMLSKGDLNLLAKLEERNAVLIGLNFNYQDRKPLLERFASEQHRRLAA